MKSARDAKKRASGEEDQASSINNSKNTIENKTKYTEIVESAAETEESNPGKKLFVDYCIRESTKCKRCKKQIPKDALRIGKMVPSRSIHISQYYHVKCAFDSFQKARVASNVITCMDDIDGLELIQDNERLQILSLMDDANAKRTKLLAQSIVRKNKTLPMQEQSARCKPMKVRNINLRKKVSKEGLKFFLYKCR